MQKYYFLLFQKEKEKGTNVFDFIESTWYVSFCLSILGVSLLPNFQKGGA